MDQEKPNVIVGVMRRTKDDLLPHEVAAVENAFPGRNICWVRIDSCDHIEHDNNCAKINTYLVVLPKDKPIPSTAMERGVVHVDLSTGKIRKLNPLKPEFEDYVPPAD